MYSSWLGGIARGVCWAAGGWLLWRVPVCRPAGPEAAKGSVADVSLVIPARNEEHRLPALLESLEVQQPASDDVVVVDDDSTDRTALVAREGGARVVTCPPLPRGWTGKAWACWTGAMTTTGRVLVFLDADVQLEPGGLAAVLAEHATGGGLLSVQPFHCTERPYEGLSAFFNLVSMMAVEAFTPRRDQAEPTGAFGPCLITTREDYLLAGGHRAVGADVLDDVGLARRFRAAGLPVTCLGGRGSVRFRMYPKGVGELVEGWTKNFAGGAGSTRPLTFVAVSAWLAGCIVTARDLLRGAGRAVRGRKAWSLVPALAWYGAYAAQVSWMLRRTGRFPRGTAAAYPLPLAGFLTIFARSLVLTYGKGEVVWKGRSVAVRR